MFASAGCPPIFGALPNNRASCAYNNSKVEQIIDSYGINHVVLVSNWQYAATKGVNLAELRETITTLSNKGIKVSIINQLPIYPINSPEYLILRLPAANHTQKTGI